MQETLDFLVNKVVKKYNKKTVLNLDHLSFQANQFVVLMGKNGSGKSTLMRLLAQQEMVDAGEILFQGQSLNSSQLKLSSRIAFISEEQTLPSKMTLKMWANLYKEWEHHYDLPLFEKLMKILGVDLEANFFGLSRGQKMKALFSLEAAKRPQVYLLDEITAVLDSGSRWVLMDYLRSEVLRGCLVVMSTNIATEVQGFATEVVVLEKGQIKLVCETLKLNEYFQKWLVLKEKDSVLKNHPQLKRVSLSGEHWVCLSRTSESVAESLTGVVKDQREVSIADVQTYFTSEEGQS